MSQFDGLVEMMRINHRNSPWAKTQSAADWIEHLQAELNELKTFTSAANAAEELGDVLQNWIAVFIALEEEQGIAVLREVIWAAQMKLRFRKPWLFDSRLPFPKDADEERAWVKLNKSKEKK